MLYQITATVTHHTNDDMCVSTTITYQIPTFYLDSEVQGIVDIIQAEKIAREIVNPAKLDELDVCIHVRPIVDTE